MSTPSLPRLTLIALVSSAVLLSCIDMSSPDKNGSGPRPNSLVTGVVRYESDKVAPNIEVKIEQEFGFEESSFIETTRTDAQGRFRLAFAHDGKTKYYVVVKGKDLWGMESREQLRPGNNLDMVLRYYLK